MCVCVQYGELQQACQGCAAQFNALTRAKHTCCVCGVAVCGNCSSDHLLLYVPDTNTPPTPAASDTTVLWCIIRFEGVRLLVNSAFVLLMFYCVFDNFIDHITTD